METEFKSDGNLCISIRLSRKGAGVNVNIKASEEVEQFMASLGDGSKQQTDVFAKGWQAKDDSGLYVYHMSTSAAKQFEALMYQYSLTYVGRELDLSQSIGGDAVNLSFLRLVGISSPSGVSFLLRNLVCSTDFLRTLKNKLGAASRNFYTDFVRKVDVGVDVIRTR